MIIVFNLQVRCWWTLCHKVKLRYNMMTLCCQCQRSRSLHADSEDDTRCSLQEIRITQIWDKLERGMIKLIIQLMRLMAAHYLIFCRRLYINKETTGGLEQAGEKTWKMQWTTPRKILHICTFNPPSSLLAGGLCPLIWCKVKLGTVNGIRTP